MSDKKRKKKIGWKGVVLAVIVVIIAIIFFNWHGLGFFGGGTGTDSSPDEAANQTEDSNNNATDEEADSAGVNEGDADKELLSVIVDGDTLFYTMNYEANEGLLETDTEGISAVIEEASITRVDLYDRGAVKKTYDDIYKLLTDKGLSVVEKKE